MTHTPLSSAPKVPRRLHRRLHPNITALKHYSITAEPRIQMSSPSCISQPSTIRIIKRRPKPSPALTRELLVSLVVAEAAWRRSPETIQVKHSVACTHARTHSHTANHPRHCLSQLFRDLGGDVWMDVVLSKQEELVAAAQLPPTDIRFLQVQPLPLPLASQLR